MKPLDRGQKISLSSLSFVRGPLLRSLALRCNLQIFPGQTIGLVGASGSGKSTLGKILVNLLEQAYFWTGILQRKRIYLTLSKKGVYFPHRRDPADHFSGSLLSLNPRDGRPGDHPGGVGHSRHGNVY